MDAGLHASMQQAHHGKLHVVNYGAKATTSAQQAYTCAKKLGAGVPLSMGGAESPCNTVSPAPRTTSIPSAILTHLAVWRQ